MLANPNITTKLLSGAKTGDITAMDVLYRGTYKPMFGICMRMLVNKKDAEDVLQEAFVIAFTKLGSLRKKENFEAWLRRIVINECICFSKARHYWMEIDAAPGEEDSSPESHSWFDAFSIETINDEISKLPTGYRHVFTLYAIEDLSHKEIAVHLGISESTSKSQYHKARKLLKERLLKTVKHG